MTLACFSHSKISSSLHKMVFKQAKIHLFKFMVKRQQLAQQRNTKPASFFTCKLWKSPDPCQISWLKDAISSSQNCHFSNIHTMLSTRTDINEYIYKYMSASYENIFQFFSTFITYLSSKTISDIRGSHPCIIEFHFDLFKRLLLLLIANEI